MRERIMRLIIGGYAQGKLTYILKKLQEEGKRSYIIVDEDSAVPADLWKTQAGDEPALDAVIVNHLHRILQKADSQEQGLQWIGRAEAYCRGRDAELIIICDELGCGVVPVVAEDREYRERVGRVLCEAAARARSVERVVCGIGVPIK